MIICEILISSPLFGLMSYKSNNQIKQDVSLISYCINNRRRKSRVSTTNGAIVKQQECMYLKQMIPAQVNLSTLAEAVEPASSSASSNNKNSGGSSSRSRYRGRFSEVRNPVRRVSSATAALQQRRASLATSVAFHSLLYHLCSFYESNPARRESLFEV